ncbi:unnamed protein product [Didymodactylos carnosus]|uniref:Cytoplasmic dynein intermediate chain n=1 Tax=Didymodactylos carnosus TaxID=1234261 RepID=A0A813TWS8_9BILA|nr:unnamed protein product [Didymodactylos carnosus]CAF0815260.1 unnamed protein product [Didymodactylos carnosus]CAF3542854.1 unnamed protein product [Didymodactylos carnosus]CAF3601315.1 unnamed protein product [Didymodactylos carnosus]
MDIRSEIELKKQKLQEIRRAKLARNPPSGGGTPVDTASSIVESSSSATIDADPDSILQQVGIKPTSSAKLLSSPNVSASPSASSINQTSSSQSSTRKVCDLQIVHLSTVSVPPKELVTYSKEVQTLESGEKDPTISPTHQDNMMQWDDEFRTLNDPNRLVYVSDGDDDSMSLITNKILGIDEDGKPRSKRKQSQSQQQHLQQQKPELTDEEKEQMFKSEKFQDFFQRSARIIERTLYEIPTTQDIFKDYSGRDMIKNEKMDIGEIIKFDREFFDERWTKHRIVTCIDISTYYPELILASYSQNDESPHESDGVALVWNTKYKQKPTPEYVYNCQSWITSCCFSKFHPNIILAGTYSGQIVVWDTRTNKRTPVQRTALSASSHTHPVYCLQVIGTQNANNLISISNEGKMCSWNMEMMSQPQEIMDLTYKSKPVAATRQAFPGTDVNNFIIGSEEGQAYSGTRHGNKAGINEAYESHFGPITGVSCHNTVNGNIDFSHLFLTSSFDWSVKLWSVKETKPLYSFEVHPSVFLTVDITGRFDIWNLNNDSELPLLTTQLEGNVALNKCIWSNNGQQIVLGDDQGKLTVYDVNELLTNPKQDDWTKFGHTLQEFRRSALEAFDDHQTTHAA